MADEVIDLIGKAQEPDGYLNTYFSINAPTKKWTNLVEGHELYTAGHMFEAGIPIICRLRSREEDIRNFFRSSRDTIWNIHRLISLL